MTDPESPSSDPGDPEDPAEKVLRTFLGEPLLWPVALVLFLVAATCGATMLVFAIRLRGIVAGIALLLLLFLTVWGLEQDIRERRLRPVSWLVFGLWLGSALVAWILDGLGAFQ